jgi:hypothetical protein
MNALNDITDHLVIVIHDGVKVSALRFRNFRTIIMKNPYEGALSASRHSKP